MFTFKMVLRDGTPADPPTFESSEPNWRAGDRAMVSPRHVYRVVAVQPAAEPEFAGTWVVEPA